MMRRLLSIVLALIPMLVFAESSSVDSTATVAAERVRTEFAWMAEAGSSIDLSANDMSSIDITAAFGLRRGVLNFAGVGLGANIMISNSCRSYPVFAIVRTNFTPKNDLVFLDVRGGLSLNYLYDNVTHTGAYAAVGLGVNLARGRKFRSYIVAGYEFMGRGDVSVGESTVHYSSLHIAAVRLGISF